MVTVNGYKLKQYVICRIMSSHYMLGKYINKLKILGRKVIQSENVSSDRNANVSVKYRDLLEAEKHNRKIYWHCVPKDIRDIIKSYLSDSEYVPHVFAHMQYDYAKLSTPIVKRHSSRDSSSPRRRRGTYRTQKIEYSYDKRKSSGRHKRLSRGSPARHSHRRYSRRHRH